MKRYGKMLGKHGKIVFADTVFKDREAFSAAVKKAKENGFLQLAEDLETEHYPTISEMETSLPQNISVSPFKSIMILSG